ncbi:hypothetical protein ACFFX0_15170 [Citricoccus parietis]|uniref:Uncharacterized protein n=1 Tax=Citricoccus parietis TaxID=592307 RepID=A0ABV5G1W3_9MICC
MPSSRRHPGASSSTRTCSGTWTDCPGGWPASPPEQRTPGVCTAGHSKTRCASEGRDPLSVGEDLPDRLTLLGLEGLL